MKRHLYWLGLFLILLIGAILVKNARSNLIPPAPPQTLIRTLKSAPDFDHNVGRVGGAGWALDYKKDRPGTALAHLRDPLLLEPGLYQISFQLRRGKYPRKGFLYQTYGLFRLELWDLNTQELIAQRELQISDFPKPNRYERRWMEFSMENRTGHIIEPRVEWFGLANGEIDRIEVSRFPDVSLRDLEGKADRLGSVMGKKFLENGFVVSRRLNGDPDELGDATTYTGWYAASLAWKYSVTHDPLTLQSLENALETLHNAVKGTYDRPLLTRYVDVNHVPHPNPASKDCYTAFFFAVKTAAPFITNPALKKQMAADLERISNRFLKEGLILTEGEGEILSLNPYFTEDEVRQGIRKLFARKEDQQKLIRGLKKANSYLPFGRLWPGFDDLMRALKKKDEDKLMSLAVPTLNGVTALMVRARDLLREQYREDLFPKRFTNKNYPGKKLEQFLTASLDKLPNRREEERFKRLSDLKILGSNGILALHIIRSAWELTHDDQFEEYYRNNLYAQDALLKTALDWDGMDEDAVRLTAGNPLADQNRNGCLAPLALFSLIQMEKNPAIRESYLTLLNRTHGSLRHDDNPLIMALHDAAFHETTHVDFVLRALELYPEDRRGYGEGYWRAHGSQVGQLLGSGEEDRHSREALPVSHRPKDSFLWQRNSRQLFGDEEKLYPPTDFLFLYWFGRAHHLIPDAPPQPTAEKPQP